MQAAANMTYIVCTIGPAPDSPAIIQALQFCYGLHPVKMARDGMDKAWFAAPIVEMIRRSK